MSDNGGNTIPPKQERMFILFSVRDDARFLSHRETQNIWLRAFVRAGIPVAYSQGFNPRAKMSLPLPRNVGVASNCELLVFSVACQTDPDSVKNALSGQLPAGIVFNRCGQLPGKDKVLPREVGYLLKPFAHVDLTSLQQNIEQLTDVAEYIATRESRGRHKARSLNIMNNIKSLMFIEGQIELVMQVDQGVTARLEEIVQSIELDIVRDIEMITRTTTSYEGIINELLGL